MGPLLLCTFQVELPALVIKTVSDFMAYHPAYCTVVHITRPLVGKEDALENSRGKLNRVLEWAVKSIDYGRPPVMYPICLVNLKE